jgi:hydroxymethylpyrimidine pyrophosphatase-like HAD family hydrolase
MLEVFSPRADKWDMACEAARRLGIADRPIVALGDGLNDLSLVRNASIGVAMANADPRISGVARAHTAAHDDDGVAVAVEALLEGRLVPGWDARAAGAGGVAR